MSKVKPMYDHPKQPKPTVPEVGPLVRALYMSENGGAGCCLHVVLDDYNIDDSSVRFCINYAIERGHSSCERLARLLLRMSKTQRGKLAGCKYTNPFTYGEDFGGPDWSAMKYSGKSQWCTGWVMTWYVEGRL